MSGPRTPIYNAEDAVSVQKNVVYMEPLDKWNMRASGKQGRCGSCKACSGESKFGMNGCFSASKHYSLNLPI